MRLMINKRGMSIAIVLLVLGTLILCTYSLYSFTTRDKYFEDTLGVSQLVGTAYEREQEINFFIQDILNSIKNPSNEDDFISKFSSELDKYKVNGEFYPIELEQVKKQLVSENVIKENGRYGVKLSITISASNEGKNAKRDSVNYTYERRFLGPVSICPAVNIKILSEESNYIFSSQWADSNVYLSKEQKASFEMGLTEIMRKNSITENLEVSISFNGEVKYHDIVLKGGANKEKIANDLKSVMNSYCIIN